MTITDKEFQRIVNYIKLHCGINLQEKRVLIVGRLENYLARNGYGSYDEYMSFVESDSTNKEMMNLINALTTNHTYFMREFTHFEFLEKYVLPKLKMSEARTKDIRIWSGASSTGEEPYTIGMVINDFFGFESKEWDTKILATDISTKVLESAVRGKYLKEQIDVLPEKWKKKYFDKIGQEEYMVKQALKDELIFRQFNLMDNFPFKKKFHVVFLRNVMIYFEEDTKRKLINKIYDNMEVGGYLFIGLSESIDKSATKFQYVQPSVFQKV